ncbi:unnamed protein product, partial [Meganyctiphanes norvegica]
KFLSSCMWRLRQNSGNLECSMCRAIHRKVNPDQLLDNYVLLEYIKSQRETKDLAIAQEYQKAYNRSEGTPIASNIRKNLDLSIEHFDPLQQLDDDDEDVFHDGPQDVFENSNTDDNLSEWQANDSIAIFTPPRYNEENRELIDLTSDSDTLEDGPILSDHSNDLSNFINATHESLVEDHINYSIENTINLSDYEIDPSHQTLIEDHESSMEEGPSEQFVEPLLELLHQYKCVNNMGVDYMKVRLEAIMSHFGLEEEMQQIIHPIIQLIQEDKLVPMGDDIFIHHLREIVRLYLMDIDV